MWKTPASKILVKNQWITLIHDKFKTSHGKCGDYYYLKSRGSSYIIPVIGDKIILEKQYRYLFNRWIIELPGGGIKNNYSSLRTAKEELAEELGYKAKFIKKIGSFIPINSIMKEICTVYMATGLKFIGKQLEETEEIKPLVVKIKDVYKMIEEGKINDGMTLAALALARKILLNIK